MSNSCKSAPSSLRLIKELLTKISLVPLQFMKELNRYKKRKMKDCNNYGLKLKLIRKNTSSSQRSIKDQIKSRKWNKHMSTKLLVLQTDYITMQQIGLRETWWRLPREYKTLNMRFPRCQTHTLSILMSMILANFLQRIMRLFMETSKTSNRDKKNSYRDSLKSESSWGLNILKKLSTALSQRLTLQVRWYVQQTLIVGTKKRHNASRGSIEKTNWRAKLQSKWKREKPIASIHSSQRSMRLAQ